MSKQPAAYLADIRQETERIQAFIQGMTAAAFAEDAKTQYAVRLAIAHIGEAVKQLPAEVTNTVPDLPWRQIAGMRDRLLHGYNTVDVVIVWRVATVSVPELATAVDAMLKDEK